MRLEPWRAEGIQALERVMGRAMPVPQDWEVLAVVDGEPIGAILIKGPEIHIGVSRPIFLRGLIRQTLCRLVKQYGCAKTVVRSSHDIGHRFVRRLGFVQTGEQNGFVFYELKDIKHA